MLQQKSLAFNNFFYQLKTLVVLYYGGLLAAAGETAITVGNLSTVLQYSYSLLSIY